MGDVVPLRRAHSNWVEGGTWLDVAAVAAEQICAIISALPMAQHRGSVLTPICIDLTIEAMEVEGCPADELDRARPIIRNAVIDFFFGTAR